jgi:hypothetical protein
MPAAFFNLQNRDVFTNGGGASHLLKIEAIEALVSREGLSIYNSITVQMADTIQYFLTFDDVIKYIHFGKGLGTMVVEGMMFCNTDGTVPGIAKFSAAVNKLRGTPIKFGLGPDTVLTVVMTNAQISIVAEPDTMGQFSFHFAIVNSH